MIDCSQIFFFSETYFYPDDFHLFPFMQFSGMKIKFFGTRNIPKKNSQQSHCGQIETPPKPATKSFRKKNKIPKSEQETCENAHAKYKRFNMPEKNINRKYICFIFSAVLAFYTSKERRNKIKIWLKLGSWLFVLCSLINSAKRNRNIWIYCTFPRRTWQTN